MAGQGSAGRFAQPGNHVDHAVRKARFLCEQTQVNRRQGSVLGRLDHHRVAGRQGGGDTPAGQENREVPGKNEPTRPPRGSNRPRFVPRDRNHTPPFGMQRQMNEVPHRVDEVLHIPFGLGQQFAAVERLDLREDRLALLHEIGQPMQLRAAFFDRQSRPRYSGKRRCRGLHRLIHFRCSRGSDFRNDLTRSRIQGLECFTSRGVNVATANDRGERLTRQKLGYFRQKRESGCSHETPRSELARKTGPVCLQCGLLTVVWQEEKMDAEESDGSEFPCSRERPPSGALFSRFPSRHAPTRTRTPTRARTRARTRAVSLVRVVGRVIARVRCASTSTSTSRCAEHEYEHE